MENLKYLKNLNIMIVEDEENIRNYLEQIFSKLFNNIYIAKNGLEGYDLLNKNKNNIDLIFTDINMPIMNGLDMLLKIKKIIEENELYIPFIISSAHSEINFLSKAIDLGVTNYSFKPLDLNKLLTLLNDLSGNIKNYKNNKKHKNILKKYEKLIEKYYIVLHTDNNGVITYENSISKIFFNKDITNKNIFELYQKNILNDVDELELVNSINNIKTKINVIKEDNGYIVIIQSLEKHEKEKQQLKQFILKIKSEKLQESLLNRDNKTTNQVENFLEKENKYIQMIENLKKKLIEKENRIILYEKEKKEFDLKIIRITEVTRNEGLKYQEKIKDLEFKIDSSEKTFKKMKMQNESMKELYEEALEEIKQKQKE